MQVTGSKLEHMEKKISVDMASVIGMATTHHKNKKVIVLTSYNNDAIMGVDYRSGRQVGVVFDDSLSLSLSLSLSHTHRPWVPSQPSSQKCPSSVSIRAEGEDLYNLNASLDYRVCYKAQVKATKSAQVSNHSSQKC